MILTPKNCSISFYSIYQNNSLFFFFGLSLSCTVMHQDCRKDSSDKSAANWPWSQCELWVWSGQFPAEATFPLQKSGCTHPEYCLPTEEAFGHLEGPAINPDTNATRMVPGRSSRSVHSNNRASANPTRQGNSLPVQLVEHSSTLLVFAAFPHFCAIFLIFDIIHSKGSLS